MNRQKKEKRQKKEQKFEYIRFDNFENEKLQPQPQKFRTNFKSIMHDQALL